MPVDLGFEAMVEKEASRDQLERGDVIGEVVGIILTLVVAYYLIGLYQSGSEFYTYRFGDIDAVIFFGIALLGIVPGLTKMMFGCRNVARPIEVAISILVLLAAAWFLTQFPFDFSHLADGLPDAWRFLLSWISDGLAKVGMALAILVSLFLIPYNLLIYIGVKKRLASAEC